MSDVMTDRHFENLRVWQNSRSFVNAIYDMMQDNRDWGFRDQIQRAAVSIMNNISEGYESGSDAKFINFLNIIKYHVSPCCTHLILIVKSRNAVPDE